MPESTQHWVPHRGLRQGLRDSSIVVKVGIVRSTTAPAHFHHAGISTVEVAY
jgi:hypothetical protein